MCNQIDYNVSHIIWLGFASQLIGTLMNIIVFCYGKREKIKGKATDALLIECLLEEEKHVVGQEFCRCL